jgi:microcystin-dependent protein
MTYQVTFTETTNPAKTPITVVDQSLNTQTSLQFPGKNYAGYAPVIANNFLHLLENFASSTSPSTPVQGQLWYDNANNLLKVYDGAGTWNEAGSIKKTGTGPTVASVGDLWSDTTNSQLYLYSGSNWLLVGPQYSEGALTGPKVETIVDTSNVSHSVVSMYSNNSLISITSKDSFTPKATILGFDFINEGVNLSAVNSTSATNPTRFTGIATAADGFLINGTVVAASNFLRGDVTSVTSVPFSVRSDGGISLGSNLSFNLGTDGSTAIIYNKTSGSPIDIKLNNAGVTNTVVHITAEGRVGLGSNNSNPASALDVGGVTTTIGINDLGSTESTALGTGSIKSAGGLSVAKKANFGSNVTTYGTVYVNNLDNNGDPVAVEGLIQPGSDAADGLYDIGTATRRFRNIYAQNFAGNFSGAFNGSFTGNINGHAASLASPTAFSITGDVTSNVISFTGQSALGTAIFNTTINQGIISSKDSAIDSQLNDELLVYRPGSAALLKMSKATLFNHVATVPVGSILPFAGATAPSGYLLCDGSEVLISNYATLFGIIGYAYKAAVLLQGAGTFAVPDLRGRFALGRDNMNNNLTVPYKDGSGTLVSAGGGSADRVTDITADTVGTGSGSQAVTLTTSNLPDHKHNLSSGAAQYYAAGLPGAAADPSAIPGLGLPASSTGSGLPNSGNVISSQTSQALNVMNPYATINYIIFTGVL